MKEDKKLERIYLTLDFIVNRMLENSNIAIVKFSNSEIVYHINERLGLNEHNKYATTGLRVGLLLKDYKIVEGDDERNRKGGAGNIIYSIKVIKIINIINRMNFDDLKEKITNITNHSSQVHKQENLF